MERTSDSFRDLDDAIKAGRLERSRAAWAAIDALRAWFARKPAPARATSGV